MAEENLILDRRIRRDLEVMGELWESLEALDPALLDDDPREAVYTAYRLHNLYNAAENVFRNVAAQFGNQLGERRGWHAELLDRMRLDLRPLRPAVIGEASFRLLDELRRFRHVFRSAYSGDLDAERLRLVLRRALELRPRLVADLGAFREFLGELDV